MPGSFDPTKDECLYETKIPGHSAGRGIKLSVHIYNRGREKVQLARYYTRDDGEDGYAKLGRMSFDELREALKTLDAFLAKRAAAIAAEAAKDCPF